MADITSFPIATTTVPALPVLAAGDMAENIQYVVNNPNVVGPSPSGTTQSVTYGAMNYQALPRQGRTVATLGDYIRNNAVFNVKDFGATGDGVTDDTAAIVAARVATTASAENSGTMYFPPGTYQCGDLGNLGIAGLTLLGSGSSSTTLKSTKTSGSGFVFDAFASGSPSAAFIGRVNCHGITFSGNPGLSPIVEVQGIFESHWTDVVAMNAEPTAGIAFLFKSVELSRFANLICSTNLTPDMDAVPYTGLRMIQGIRGITPAGNSSNNTFTNCYMEGLSVGMDLDEANQNVFIGGSAEANSVWDFLVGDTSQYNVMIGMGYESVLPTTAIGNVSDGGRYTAFINCYSNWKFVFASTARRCILDGGVHDSITISSGAIGCTVQRLAFNNSGSGTYSDAGEQTSWLHLFDIGNGVGFFPLKARNSVSVGASPWTYTNATGFPLQLIVQTGTISSAVGHRGGDSWALSATAPGTYLVMPGDAIVFTYSSTAPVVSQLPLNGFPG